MPSIYDVAREARVSIATVSRVFRGTAPVSAATRERVLAAARALGYRPNRIARALAEGRTRAIGVMLPTDISNPFYAQLAQHVASCARTASYDVAVGLPPDDSVESFLETTAALEERQVDGLLLCASCSRVAAYAARRPQGACPAVAVGCLPTVDVPLVSADEEYGGYLITNHLLALGHRRVAFLCAPGQPGTAHPQGREHGYIRAMDARGLEPLLWHGVGTLESGYTRVRDLLAEHDDLTALVAVNDAAALGALRALYELKRPVPAHVSLTGFDNVVQGVYSAPALTSVDLPVAEMAERAVRLLLSLVGCDGTVPTRIIVRPRLVVRESTAPPRPH